MTDQQRERLQTLITASKAQVDREDVEQIADKLEQESGATRLTAGDGVSVSVPTGQLPHAVRVRDGWRGLAAWMRAPGTIDKEDAIDCCARAVENYAEYQFQLAPALQSPAWQSISSAPKDADLILLYLEGSGVRPGYWDDDARWDDKLKRYVDGRGRWLAVESQGLTGGTWQAEPSHWMPLPSPPVTDTAPSKVEG